MEQERKVLSRLHPTVDHEPPSALDHNNFADLFMKRRKYEDAFAELKKAVDEVRTPNALFCKTSADIFWKRRDTSNALRALGGCTATDALLGSVQDVKQYVENQIFAAKLVAASPEMAGSYLPLTTSTLESVSRFVDEQKTLLGSSSADELQTKVLELLGRAFLQMPGSEDRAVKSFDLLRELGINVRMRPNGSVKSAWPKPCCDVRQRNTETSVLPTLRSRENARAPNLRLVRQSSLTSSHWTRQKPHHCHAAAASFAFTWTP